MEDLHHTHREVPTGWLAALIELIIWAQSDPLEGYEPPLRGRTEPTPLAEGLNRLSSPH